MSPEPDFLKTPEYEVNADSFIEDLVQIQIKYFDMRIFGVNLTKSQDEIYAESFEDLQSEDRKLLKPLMLAIDKDAEIDSSSKNIVSVHLIGEPIRIAEAEGDVDRLAEKHRGTITNVDMDDWINSLSSKLKEEEGSTRQPKMLHYEFTSHQA